MRANYRTDDVDSSETYAVGVPIVSPVSSSRPPGRPGLAVRCLDLVVSVGALIVLSPLLIALVVAVKLSSPGPVIYGSLRIGAEDTVFRAWKFRSMWSDADERLAELLRSDPEANAEYATYRKLRNDPRVTSVGRFIRKTSLDELPQLINIIRGEMSVVGPRPKLLNEREVFGSALPVILTVRPGLTGLWQVSGRSRLDLEDRILLDVKYVQERTIGTDLGICVTTFMQLFRPGRHGGV